MKDKCSRDKIKVVFSRNSSLPTKRSKFSKPKLQLINNPKRRQLRILIGDYQDNIGISVVAWIRFLTKDKYELKVMTALFAEELLELMQDHTFDIFIPILNNIFFLPKNLPVEKRVEKGLQLITHFRITYKKPIITLFGWPDDPSYVEKIKQAGANFAFKIPYEAEDFSEAFKKCLDKIT